jgi:branched-chain amino acid transport system ATP-binding protein
MLETIDLSAGYSRVPVIAGVSISVAAGSTIAVVGPNGAGKTTLARTISGFTRVLGGSIHFDGHDVTSMSSRRRALLGIVQVPEGRRLFSPLSVAENLDIAFFARRRAVGPRRRALLDEAFDYFPVLAARRDQRAGTLSGGEQQMLAIARALLLEPKVLVLDEPSIGLAPAVRREIFEVVVARVAASNCACVLIEQRARDALRIADHGYVLDRGEVVLGAPASRILGDESLRRSYVGA